MTTMTSFIRRRTPSVAALSYNPLFKVAGRVTDWIAELAYAEFRSLPPNHLRVRVGVGNRIFLNQIVCIKSGYNFWINALAAGLCHLDSNVVEIGCGYGRKVAHLRNYNIQGQRFTGEYVGIDVDRELLDYARSTYPPPQYRFFESTDETTVYGHRIEPAGLEHADTGYRLPIGDGTQDFVYSTSLFTHLLEGEAFNYLRESFRVLREGGHMQMNYFSIDFMRSTGLVPGRWTFRHAIDNALVESVDSPEAAVAYRDSYLQDLCREIGFSRVEVLSDPNGEMSQSFLRGQK